MKNSNEAYHHLTFTTYDLNAKEDNGHIEVGGMAIQNMKAPFEIIIAKFEVQHIEILSKFYRIFRLFFFSSNFIEILSKFQTFFFFFKFCRII